MLFTYRLFCVTGNHLKLITQSSLLAAPTACPDHPAGTINSDSVGVVTSIEETYASTTQEFSTTNTSSYQTDTYCQLTPSEGTWDVILSFQGETTGDPDPEGGVAIFVGSTMVTDSERKIKNNVSAAALLGAEASGIVGGAYFIRTRVTVDGTQTICAKIKALKSGSGIKLNGRSLTIERAE